MSGRKFRYEWKILQMFSTGIVFFEDTVNHSTCGESIILFNKKIIYMRNRLENRIVTNSGTNAQLVCPVDHTDETLPFIKPKGVLFLKITKGKIKSNMHPGSHIYIRTILFFYLRMGKVAINFSMIILT